MYQHSISRRESTPIGNVSLFPQNVPVIMSIELMQFFILGLTRLILEFIVYCFQQIQVDCSRSCSYTKQKKSKF